MKRLELVNPFGAPVYHEETVACTMDVSRVLADNGAPHGTVITADFQEEGRGRVRGRLWEMERGGNLAFTILLRYPRIEDIPPALTLRVGLALSLAIEDFAPVLIGSLMIKWPNDVMLCGVGKARAAKAQAAGKAQAAKAQAAGKAAGILTEAEGGNVFIGIGVNVTQKRFPVHLREKATSLCLAVNNATGGGIFGGDKFALLEKILARLYDEAGTVNGAFPRVDWKSRVEARLYKKGEQVCFAEGAADSGKIVTGILAGLGPSGELLITPNGETETRSFTTGELVRS